jgi:two-component system, OmpR family, alkaline phosphatase synthesis response regulator PhoP
MLYFRQAIALACQGFVETRMPDARILLVDDEQNILDLVSAYLQKEGYTVYTATDGPAGLKAALSMKPDLIILDVMLPGLGGIELLVELRRVSNAYVIMLSARAEETDKIVGLSVGADDYLAKPFSPRELVARVRAALRRLSATPSPDHADIVAFRHIRIDASRRKVWKDDAPVDLTEAEFDLLLALAQHPGRVLSRDQLLQRVWGNDFYGEERVIDVHVGHIRRKLGEDPANPHFIVTVRGVGYRFEDELMGT